MHQCSDCGSVIADMTLIPNETLSESMRVFCPKHDMHRARYTDGRPLLNDKCPMCEIEDLRIKLDALIPTPSCKTCWCGGLHLSEDHPVILK